MKGIVNNVKDNAVLRVIDYTKFISSTNIKKL